MDDLPDQRVEDEDAGADESDQWEQVKVIRKRLNTMSLTEETDGIQLTLMRLHAKMCHHSSGSLIIQQQEDPALQPLIAEARSRTNPKFHIRDGLLLRKVH